MRLTRPLCVQITRFLSAKKISPYVPNQKPGSMWQDPVFGYFETHGKMEFKAGEEYDVTEEQKKAIMDRYYKKERLKQEFLALEYNPQRFRYIEGVIMDPALFRWYATDMSHVERFRVSPKTVFVFFGIIAVFVYFFQRFTMRPRLVFEDKSYKGEYLWWDRANRWFSESGVGKAATGQCGF